VRFGQLINVVKRNNAIQPHLSSAKSSNAVRKVCGVWSGELDQVVIDKLRAGFCIVSRFGSMITTGQEFQSGALTRLKHRMYAIMMLSIPQRLSCMQISNRTTRINMFLGVDAQYESCTLRNVSRGEDYLLRNVVGIK
jgi:hypothetical protein